jgi:hypothetical protein
MTLIAEFDLSDPSTITVDERGNVVSIHDKEPTTGPRIVAEAVLDRLPTVAEHVGLATYFARLTGFVRIVDPTPPDETH